VLTADSSLDDVPTPDIIVIPGSGKVPFLGDSAAVAPGTSSASRRDH
jgi:hypothetical protein